jgi:folate-binding Fe-S cluster repair protein YgfZ
MDQFGGVDFDKGCFVGQEVVSRMEHRGTARSRIVPVSYAGFPPEPGTPMTAGEKPVGTFGSSAEGHAVAMLRLDRVADAIAAGQPLAAGGVAMQLVKPAWARFAFPGEAKAAE